MVNPRGESRTPYVQALVPLMKLWLASIDPSLMSVPRPLDLPQAHARGFDSDKILIFGGGAAVGRGVSTHDLALPGALARAVSSRTGRGSDVDVVAISQLRVKTALTKLRSLHLWRYDVVIVIVGIDDALQLSRPDLWRRRMSTLLDTISADTPIVVAGIPPIRSLSIFDSALGGVADRRALMLNREMAALCAGREGMIFAPLTVLDGPGSRQDRHRGPEEYRHWAGLLADPTTRLLSETHFAKCVRGLSGTPEPAVAESAAESDDAGAADEVVDGDQDQTLDYIVTMAQRAFHTETACLTLLDDDRRRYVAFAGKDRTDVVGAGALDDYTVTGAGPVIVRDTRDDERFRDSPILVEGHPIRFYAGFPIESPSGRRVGTLSVMGAEPRRRAADVDVLLLRELALQAQRQLWRYLPQR